VNALGNHLSCLVQWLLTAVTMAPLLGTRASNLPPPNAIRVGLVPQVRDVNLADAGLALYKATAFRHLSKGITVLAAKRGCPA